MLSRPPTYLPAAANTRNGNQASLWPATPRLPTARAQNAGNRPQEAGLPCLEVFHCSRHPAASRPGKDSSPGRRRGARRRVIRPPLRIAKGPAEVRCKIRLGFCWSEYPGQGTPGLRDRVDQQPTLTPKSLGWSVDDFVAVGSLQVQQGSTGPQQVGNNSLYRK